MSVLKTGCMILFLSHGAPASQSGIIPEVQPGWAQMEVQNPRLCDNILLTLAILTDPEQEKKIQELEKQQAPPSDEPAKKE